MPESPVRDALIARLESLDPTTAALPASLEASVLAIASRITGMDTRAAIAALGRARMTFEASRWAHPLSAAESSLALAAGDGDRA
jgi:hypothetical protein